MGGIERVMKTTMYIAAALGLSIASTGCVATHKYVAKTIAPVEQRVSGTESKNADQDKQLGAHDTHLTEIDRDASQTKEKLGDTDAKAVRAGAAASVADQKAVSAQQSA